MIGQFYFVLWVIGIYESLEGSNKENKKIIKSRNYEIKSRNYEIKSRNNEIKSRNNEIKSRNYEMQSRNYEIIMVYYIDRRDCVSLF